MKLLRSIGIGIGMAIAITVVIADDKYGFLIDLEARDGSGGVPHAVNSWLEEETNNV